MQGFPFDFVGPILLELRGDKYYVVHRTAGSPGTVKDTEPITLDLPRIFFMGKRSNPYKQSDFLLFFVKTIVLKPLEVLQKVLKIFKNYVKTRRHFRLNYSARQTFSHCVRTTLILQIRRINLVLQVNPTADGYCILLL